MRSVFDQVGTCSAVRGFSLVRWGGSDRVESPEALEAGSCTGRERCVGNAYIVVRAGDPGVAFKGLVADLGRFIACIDWEAHPPDPAPVSQASGFGRDAAFTDGGGDFACGVRGGTDRLRVEVWGGNGGIRTGGAGASEAGLVRADQAPAGS